MAAGSDDFDLSMAWYRKAQSDLRAFMEAFAVRMAGAAPDRVKVERRRDGLFSRTSHVARVTIASDPNVYVLSFDNSHLSAHRAKAVRGVILKSEPMDFPEWLAALNADLQRLAERAGAAQNVLHDFLMS
ncbi:MAG TPA: hypothetical protein VJ770_08905 [Stellaceae bacterium]|nr:hypothetical protein [Stellaceae bacterium]